MQLLDATGEIDDLWPEAGETLPDAGRILVPLERLEQALASPLEIGVHIPNDTDPKSLIPHFGRLAMISVDFPSFADGRGFSIGRCLRGEGFVGRLRATGPVISDQFTYLMQCGFDEIALPDAVASRQPLEDWLSQPELVTLGYQRGRQGRGSILDQRRNHA
ncbi:MAG: DUF934 domain-containing protein [Pseudomonadota bacterium]